MLSIISPSKTMDFNCRAYPVKTSPCFISQSRELATRLKKLSPADLEEFMKISPRLAVLTHQQYQEFSENEAGNRSCQALLTYRGDAFQALDITHYKDEDFSFAQKHVRILSGLYGILRPLDTISPYRLEMAARLSGPWGKNLYDFWKDRITQEINEQMDESQGARVLINLASNEYSKVVGRKNLKADILQIQFREKRGNAFKVIAVHAKRARGEMVDFIIQKKITNPESLKGFICNGYAFNPDISTSETWVFSRK